MKFFLTPLFFCWFSSQFSTSEAASCTRIGFKDFPKPECTSYVVIGNTPVYRNNFDVRITLTGRLTSVRWFCGEHDGAYTWAQTGKTANQVRASFIAGELKLEVYSCDDLSGPTRPQTCAFNTFGAACPGLTTSDHTCVYEIKETKLSAQTSVDAFQVGGTIAAGVKGVLGGISTNVLRERSQATIVTYSSRSYIVVPAGYRFCSYSEAKAVRNRLAPTGYEWHCFLPKFFQGRTTGQCSSFTHCRKLTCAVDKKPIIGPSGGAIMSSFNSWILIAISAVIMICS